MRHDYLGTLHISESAQTLLQQFDDYQPKITTAGRNKPAAQPAVLPLSALHFPPNSATITAHFSRENGTAHEVCLFNINGLRARPHQLAAIIEQHQPDVIGLQETKVHDDMFPLEEVSQHGYHVFYHGQKAITA